MGKSQRLFRMQHPLAGNDAHHLSNKVTRKAAQNRDEPTAIEGSWLPVKCCLYW